MAPPPSASNNGYIITDAMVVIMMIIFNSQKMFDDAEYSFGEVHIHVCTHNEIKRWLIHGGRKLTRLTEPVVQQAVDMCVEYQFSLEDLTDEEKTKVFARYRRIEAGFNDNQRSSETSNEDKHLLALAKKNNCRLATQETSLRSLAINVIDTDLISFEDMVKDLFDQGQLTEKDIRDGIDNLSFLGENLRGDQRDKLYKILGWS